MYRKGAKVFVRYEMAMNKKPDSGLSFCFLQFFDYLSGFFFGREFDSAGRALFFTACKEHYTIIGIFYGRSRFSLVLFKLVRAERTVVYAFSAADAFFIVYCWIPRYLASMNTMICFFRHSFFTIFIGEWFML